MLVKRVFYHRAASGIDHRAKRHLMCRLGVGQPQRV
ncbi:hypothetical protein CI1B_02460 [Bradyrhizobium ivorense]|uniref:Uncharacterized protein n=1 Tax=Bradyrhizobium ivorense TaxID=2511166 RepID=A0A508SRY6_9BRAD|nr:hypothetical protein CI1B_02460 [Bradyrhizobium ivorense]VIO71995.1 hypothetical protein CI41S_33620 [Bradyrhizobium ivorense]